MTLTKVEIDVPEEIVPYTVLKDKDAQITRNAMLVYPYNPIPALEGKWGKQAVPFNH